MLDKDTVKITDLRDLEVLVERPIWVSSRVWDPKLYKNPPDVLLKAALDVFDRDDKTVHFAKNGKRFNPFSTATVVDLDTPEEVEEEIVDDEEPTQPPEVVPEEKKEKIVVPEFKKVIDFAEMSKTEQFDYIDAIKDTPDFEDPDDADAYESNLFSMLNEYKKVATGSKALKLIDEVLADYNV